MLDWSKNKDKADILLLKYEDLKQDVVSEIKKMAAFLDVELSDSHLHKIVHDAGIKQMKADEALEVPVLIAKGDLVRSGKSGGWKNYFTVKQNEWFDGKFKKLYEELDIPIEYK